MDTRDFIAITYVSKEDIYKIVTFSIDVSGSLVPQQVYTGMQGQVLAAVNNGCIPLNFGVKNGKIVEDWGSFSRFKNIPCFIVLSEIITQAGRKLGYRIYDVYSDTVSNIKLEQIREHVKANPSVVLFQNAIIKNNSVYAYPNKEFLKMVVGTSALKMERKAKHAVHDKKVKQQAEPTPKKKNFSAKQLEVIEKAKQNGITGSWLSNPDISAKQMNLLCRAKSKGALAEYFADPRMEADHIDFWADRLYDEKLAQDCKPLLKRPDIAIEPLTDLFDCAVDGTEYEDLIDEPSKKIRKEHYMRSDKFWCKPKLIPKSEEDFGVRVYAAQLKKDCDTLKTGTPVIKR